MKKSVLKYLLAFAPVLLCAILSFAYTRITPREISDLQNPYRTQPLLEYLSVSWFYIGIVLSLVFLSIVFIDDVFSRIQNYLERRNMQQHEQRRKIT